MTPHRNLLQVLAGRDREDVVLHTQAGPLSVGFLIDAVSACRTLWPTLKGKAIRLKGETDLDQIMGMALLDGFASAMILGDGPEAEFTIQVQQGAFQWDGQSCDWSNSSHRDPSDTDIATRWFVPTSGTTSAPRCVAHDFKTLTRFTKSANEHGRGLVWGLLYETQRFAGLQVVLQALVGGSTLAVPKDLNDLHGITAFFKGAGVNALSGTPSNWRRLLMREVLDELQLKVVTLGGEIADAQILTELRNRFPQARLTHIYASTEFGVGFAINDGKAGFPASYVDEREDVLVSETNTLQLRTLQGEWMDTGDLVERRGDRYYFCGRADGRINVGGIKVAPESVEEVLLEVPGVAMAMAVARRSSIIGEVVEARIVAQPGHADVDQLTEAVQEACRQGLRPEAVPALVRIVDSLPITGAGKVDRLPGNVSQGVD